MSLDLPVVGEAGPVWATKIIDAFLDLDGRVGVGSGYYDVPAGSTQAAMEALATSWRATGGVLRFLPGTHTFTASIMLPASALSGQAFSSWAVEGEPGAILTTSTAGVVFFDDTVPADTAAASNRTNRLFTFRNLVMIGSGGAAQGGIRVIGSYALVAESCLARFVGTGFDFIFCLMGRAQSCITSGCVTFGFRARSAQGVIGDASHTTSASNMFVFEQCRDYGSSTMTAQFDVLGTNEVAIRDCITEGVAGVDAIRWDRGNSPNVQQFLVSHHHFENSPSNAQVHLIGNGGLVTVERIDWTVGAIMIDAADMTVGLVVVRDCPYLVGKFRHANSGGPATGVAWSFDMVGGVGFDLAASSIWDNAIVPTYRSVRRFSGGSDGASGNFPTLEGAGIYLRTNSLIHSHTVTSPSIAAHWGPSAFSAWAAAANPAFLVNGEFQVWINESTNKLTFQVKYSNGTVKTGEVSLA